MERGIARYEEKKIMLAYLISRFGYTTKQLFTEMLGCKKRSQDNFFSTLEARRMIRPFSFLEHRNPIYLPRKRFIEIISELYPESKIPITTPSKIPERLIRHTLFCQKIIINEGGFEINYITDRMMMDGRKKRPDMIINKSHAIEAELTYKGHNKSIQAFLNLLLEINLKHYEKVTYYTPNNYIYNQLKRAFNENVWPVPRGKNKVTMREIDPKAKENISFIFLEK